MKICGHSLRDHIRLLKPLFVVITAMWFLRLVLEKAGVAQAVVRMFSVTWACALAILLAALLIHIRRFGSYPNVVVASILLSAWGQLLIVLSIVFAVVTGINNVFTRPEFSVPGDDRYHIRHILGHLTFLIGLGVLIGAASGCLVLLILRLLVPLDGREARR